LCDDVNYEKNYLKKVRCFTSYITEKTLFLCYKDKWHNDVYGKIHKQDVTSTYTEWIDHRMSIVEVGGARNNHSA
jgi:hypothetical protein